MRRAERLRGRAAPPAAFLPALLAPLGLLALLALPAVAHDRLPAPPQQRPVLVRGGLVHTVSHGTAVADVLFDAGTIVAVGPDLAAPPTAEIVDAGGRHVYPGLIAAQTQIGLVEIGAVRATVDRAETGDVTPEAAAHIAWEPDSEIIPTIRNHGIAIAQVVPTGTLVRGRPFLTRLDGWTKEDAGLRLEHGLQIGWPSLATPRRPREGDEKRDDRATEQRRALRQAFRDAGAWLAAAAADPATPIDVRWQAMAPVLRGEEPVFVAADDARQIVEALEFAGEFDLRLVIAGGAEAHLVADRLRAADVPVLLDSTMALPSHADDPYDTRFRLPALLSEAGVRYAIAHITWGPWDVRNLPLQAGQAIAFGLDPEEAVRALTLSPAEILGLADRYGSLEPGKSATLFVSDGDVTDVLGQRVRRLWIDGRDVDLDDRQRALWRKYEQRGAPAAVLE